MRSVHRGANLLLDHILTLDDVWDVDKQVFNEDMAIAALYIGAYADSLHDCGLRGEELE